MTTAVFASPPVGPSVWLMAARPRTLSLSVMPVLVGTALAWAETAHVIWSVVIGALLGAVLIQIGTNLHNDAADSERGADGPGRIGPARVTAAGLRSAKQVRRAAFLSFAGAAAVGVYLVTVGGWPILALGLASILAGWGYTGGPRPIAYTPLGEVFVLFFFGLAAVCGTYWLHAAEISCAAVATGAALGSFAAAVLLVNNHRDREEDGRAGRRTLAILAGPRLTSLLYAGMMLAPFALLPALGRALPDGRHAWPAFLALPLALWMVRRFVTEPKGRGLNLVLGRTAQVQLAYALMLCLGLLW